MHLCNLYFPDISSDSNYPYEKHEFKQFFTSEVILIWPSLLSPVITFLKLSQIKKKTKVNPTGFLELLSFLIDMIFLLFFSPKKHKQAIFYFSFGFFFRAGIVHTKRNSFNLKISAGLSLWDESLFDSLWQTK